MKVLNPTPCPVTLWRNAKIADVFTCVAVEDVPIAQGLCTSQNDQLTGPAPSLGAAPDLSQQLKDCGLSDLDISGCDVSDAWKRKLAELILTYQMSSLRTSWTTVKPRSLSIVFISLMTAPFGYPFDVSPKYTIKS